MAKYTIKKVLGVIGRDIPDAGSVMYHAADGVTGGGKVNSEKRHQMRKALAKHRMRASGMSDDIFGSKEVGGRFENDYEAKV